MAETNEVAPPSTRVPDVTEFEDQSTRQFQLSPAGQALRAAMGKSTTGAELPAEDRPEADKPEEEQPTDPQAERATPRPEVDTAIEPLTVSDRYRADAEGYRQDAATIAREHNIPAAEMSALYSFVGSAAAAELATAASDAVSYGQTPGPNLADPNATRHFIRTKYGAMGDALMAAASKEFHALPKDVQAWLEHDHGDGRRLSNHPNLIEMLALRPFAKLSPDAARAEMGRIRASAEFSRGEPLSLAKVKMLAFVIAGKKPETPSAPQPNRGTVYKTDSRGGSDPAFPSQGTQAAAALRAELKKLQAKESDLFSSDGQKRKRAIARRQAIHAQLEGSR